MVRGQPLHNRDNSPGLGGIDDLESFISNLDHGLGRSRKGSTNATDSAGFFVGASKNAARGSRSGVNSALVSQTELAKNAVAKK